MSKRLIWVDGDKFAGWCCSQCMWGPTAPRLESTVAALAFTALRKRTLRNTTAQAARTENRVLGATLSLEPREARQEVSGSWRRQSLDQKTDIHVRNHRRRPPLGISTRESYTTKSDGDITAQRSSSWASVTRQEVAAATLVAALEPDAESRRTSQRSPIRFPAQR